MNPRLLLRLARLARQRPSRGRALVIVGAIAITLALAGLESLWGRPDAQTPERAGRAAPALARP